MDPMVAITEIMEAIVAAAISIISDKIVMAAMREITAATATVEIIIDSLNHLPTLPINKSYYYWETSKKTRNIGMLDRVMM